MATEEQLRYLEKYIEQYCAEADKRCQVIDPIKAVDQVIEEMTEEQFIRFSKPIIEDVTNRLKKAKAKQKKKKKQKAEQKEKEEEETDEKETEETEKEKGIMEEAVVIEQEKEEEQIPA